MATTSPGTVGPYRVEREIGRGGMGVVFLAHDTRLDRRVALKALPDEVSADPVRLQRFEREAKVLASISHPNIAGIYGVEEAAGRRYLALEYVEGETLAERLARGPLSLEDTMDICLQIAAGVEAAHEAGIIHRDLKPDNVVISSDDRAKVVDFGLAKGRVVGEGPLSDSPARWDSPALASSPTVTQSPVPWSPGTIPGVVLGTAPYLSPEQARGKAVDRRTDIWSFGCVLYECLTGTRAFRGETASDTIAKILEGRVEWSRLPKQTAPRLVELLARCLEKDPRQRLRDMGDARLTLEEIRSGRVVTAAAGAVGTSTPPAGAARGRVPALVAVAAAIAGTLLGAAAWNALRPATREGALKPIRLAVPVPPSFRFQAGEVSPDGNAFFLLGSLGTAGASEAARPRIYFRRADQPSFEPLRGTDGAASIVVSPDSRWIAFASAPPSGQGQFRLFKMPIDGSSPPVPLRNYDRSWDFDAAWLRSGDFIISTERGERYIRLSADGTASAPRKFDLPGFTGSLRPVGPPLPGDRGVLLRAIWYQEGVFCQGIAVLDLKSGKTKLLIRDGGCPQYSATGHLLFTKQAALLAVPFDLSSLEVRGEPVALLGDLRQFRQGLHAEYRFTSNGMLTFVAGGDVGRNRRAIVVDQSGRVSDWSSERQAWDYIINASPDGTRFVGSVNSADAITELWISERGRAASYRLRARPGADCMAPIWSPDGRRIAYFQASQSADDGVYVTSVDGASPPRRIASRTSPSVLIFPTSWSPDGSTILAFQAEAHRFAMCALAANPPEGSLSTPRRLFADEERRGAGLFSPDGRLVAYRSEESGKSEIYVCAWNGDALTGRPLLVSTGGAIPRWGRDSGTLYYESPENKLMAVRLSVAPELKASAPTMAWDLDALRVPFNLGGGPMFDLLRDGSLLAVQRGEGEDDLTRLDVVLHFSEELKQRMRAPGR